MLSYGFLTRSLKCFRSKISFLLLRMLYIIGMTQSAALNAWFVGATEVCNVGTISNHKVASTYTYIENIDAEHWGGRGNDIFFMYSQIVQKEMGLNQMYRWKSVNNRGIPHSGKYQYRSVLPKIKYNCAVFILSQMYWLLCMLPNIFLIDFHCKISIRNLWNQSNVRMMFLQGVQVL